MPRSTMQDNHPLTLTHVLGRMRTFHGDARCIAVEGDGTLTEITYRDLATRVDALASNLARMVGPGEVVASLCPNTRDHLELYLAVPAIGATLHTLNPRMSARQLAAVIGETGDRLLFADAQFLELAREACEPLASPPRIVVLGADDEFHTPPESDFSYPELDDRGAAMICHTSGTTGTPKGVAYSHRSLVLHAMMLGLADVLGLGVRETALPIVPMYHANAWGIPHASCLLGANLVLPGSKLDGGSLRRLIEATRPTVTGGVATVWQELLREADEHGGGLSSLRLVVSGGAPMPRALMEAYEDRHGVRMVQAWGMTETGPFAAIATPPPGLGVEDDRATRTRTGQLVPCLDMRIVDEDDRELPWDGDARGELEVRGPWVAASYLGARGGDRFDAGWLRTGDVARLTPDGFITIVDREKDLVKSGGEWISSVELENTLMEHPRVIEAAVVARPDDRWGERPVAFVVTAADAPFTLEDAAEHLAGKVPRWWLPDDLVRVAEIPRTSVGKYDKQALRSCYRRGETIP